MIILDGTHISELGFEAEPFYEDPITPFLEHKTVAIPGRVGFWDFGTESREKPFAFNLTLHNRFQDNIQSAYNKLVKLLFDEYGRAKTIKLVREYEPDKFYYVKVAEQLIPERLVDEGRLILRLIAFDPFKYSKNYADEITWGSKEITFESEFLLGHTNDFGGGSVHVTGPQSFNITVSGIAVQPTIYIEGSANNLTLSANGHSFSLPNFTNEIWEIDVNHYVAFRNNQETIIDIREFFLLPGDNKIQIDGDNIDIELSVKFRDKYN